MNAGYDYEVIYTHGFIESGIKLLLLIINEMNLNRLALINISHLHVLENIPIVTIVMTLNMKHLNTQDQRNVKIVL